MVKNKSMTSFYLVLNYAIMYPKITLIALNNNKRTQDITEKTWAIATTNPAE